MGGKLKRVLGCRNGSWHVKRVFGESKRMLVGRRLGRLACVGCRELVVVLVGCRRPAFTFVGGLVVAAAKARDVSRLGPPSPAATVGLLPFAVVVVTYNVVLWGLVTCPVLSPAYCCCCCFTVDHRPLLWRLVVVVFEEKTTS